MSNAPKGLHLTLNAASVAAPALRAMRHTSELLAICLNALENVNLEQPPQIPGAFFTWGFGPLVKDKELRKRAYINWLLNKGFQDLASGVRQSLEAALLFIDCVNAPGGRTTWGAIQATKRRARRLKFPELLRRVNQGLTEPLHFEEEYLSLQKVRNVLEHSGGIVTDNDTNHEGNALRLVLPRFKMFIKRSGVEVEVHRNMVVEAGEVICMRREKQERHFKIGDLVTFNAAEFYEIASACFFFASDLQMKLPTQQPSAEAA